MAATQRSIVQWREAVETGWGATRWGALLDELTPIVTALVAGEPSPAARLHDYGHRCGAHGLSLQIANAWLDELARVVSRRVRSRLDRRDTAIAIAHGWIGGVMERGRALDGEMVSSDVLRYRLEQQYDRCDALGIETPSAHVLVVFEAGCGDGAGNPLHRAEPALGSVVLGQFRSGETVAATTNGRVLVLADRASDLASRVRRTLTLAREHPGLAGTDVRGWIEPLAADRAHLDEHLAGLL